MSDICSIFKQWQYETDKRHQENGKLRHDYFVTAKIKNIWQSQDCTFFGYIKNDLRKPKRWIHIAALLGVRHYCYMWLNYGTRLIRYHDSSHYDLKRRATKRIQCHKTKMHLQNCEEMDRDHLREEVQFCCGESC